MEFPAFRNAEWLERALGSAGNSPLVPPKEMLHNVDLSPSYMMQFEYVSLYPWKAEAVKKAIRTALFRQTLFKVQNVEVMTLKGCKKNRVLKNIQRSNPSLLNAMFERNQRKVITEEIWEVDRCGKTVEYKVKYINEDGNSFTSCVIPMNHLDKLRAFRYYVSARFSRKRERQS